MSFVEYDNIIYRIERNSAIVHYLNNLFDVNIIIPETIEGKTVISIGPKAFAKTNIHSIQIPDTVRIINNNAFAECHELKEVEFYKSSAVNKSRAHLIIGSAAFFKCYNLAKFKTLQNTTFIGESAFKGCTMLSSFEVNVLHAKKESFTDCVHLESITVVPDGRLWAGSIEKSNLKHLNIWGNVTITASIVNFLRKRNITIHCEPSSNITELSYVGINVSYLY